MEGTLTVRDDTVASDCTATAGIFGTLRFGDVVAVPGRPVTVPLLVSTDAGAQGVEFSVLFDHEILLATNVRSLWRRPDRRAFDIVLFDIYNEDETIEREDSESGAIEQVGIQAGGAVGGFFMIANPLSDDQRLPVGEEIPFLEIDFDTAEEASGSTVVRFTRSADDRVWVRSREVTATVCSRDRRACYSLDRYSNALERRHDTSPSRTVVQDTVASSAPRLVHPLWSADSDRAGARGILSACKKQFRSLLARAIPDHSEHHCGMVSTIPKSYAEWSPWTRGRDSTHRSCPHT